MSKETNTSLVYNERFGLTTTLSRSKLMGQIRSNDTKQEIKLRKALWNRGYRFRKNFKFLIGKPDITFIGLKVAIFIDGSFWHGFNWETRKSKIKSNREYWIKKIERNIERDKKINASLRELGWQVLRYWEHDLQANFDRCLADVESKLRKRKVEK